MKKTFMIFVSVALALLVASNIFLVLQVSKLTGSRSNTTGYISPEKDSIELLEGKWKSGYDRDNYLYFYEDGSFEKVERDSGIILGYGKGYLDGYTMIYTHSYYLYDSDMTTEYTDTSQLPLKEYSFFTTITVYGDNAISENQVGFASGSQEIFLRQK